MRLDRDDQSPIGVCCGSPVGNHDRPISQKHGFRRMVGATSLQRRQDIEICIDRMGVPQKLSNDMMVALSQSGHTAVQGGLSCCNPTKCEDNTASKQICMITRTPFDAMGFYVHESLVRPRRPEPIIAKWSNALPARSHCATTLVWKRLPPLE